ncbi:hypothetical protein TNCT_59701 [Trichonephila clavata]|uniref:Uncharacterized protein n=1 Tax=Trichonephila clavata TaxID=2740835 RepID=A0A8X6KXZ4_TRICU|nr:hypothetical protein TNCT_59701 [Trichonephila clavata]
MLAALLRDCCIWEMGRFVILMRQFIFVIRHEDCISSIRGNHDVFVLFMTKFDLNCGTENLILIESDNGTASQSCISSYGT